MDSLELKKQGVFYSFVIQSKKYKKLLAVQSKPELKYYFKDEEINIEEFIKILENTAIKAKSGDYCAVCGSDTFYNDNND